MKTINAEVISSKSYDANGIRIPTWDDLERAVSKSAKQLFGSYHDPRHITQEQRFNIKDLLGLVSLMLLVGGLIVLTALFERLTYWQVATFHRNEALVSAATVVVSLPALILLIRSKQKRVRVLDENTVQMVSNYQSVVGCLRKALGNELSGYNPDTNNLREFLSDKLEESALRQIELEENEPEQAHKCREKTYLLIEVGLNMGYFMSVYESEEETQTPKAYVYRWAQGLTTERPWRGPKE